MSDSVGRDVLTAAKIQLQAKSMVAGILLPLFFGGLGVFYVSFIGGLICVILEILLILLGLITLGAGFALIFPAHLLFALFTVILVNRHNKRLLRKLERMEDVRETF